MSVVCLVPCCLGCRLLWKRSNSSVVSGSPLSRTIVSLLSSAVVYLSPPQGAEVRLTSGS